MKNIGYEMLYAAIFKQAVKDSKRHIKAIIFKKLSEVCSNKSQIHQFMKKHMKKIDNTIEHAVYEEAQLWPITLTQRIKIEDKIAQKYISLFLNKTHKGVDNK